MFSRSSKKAGGAGALRDLLQRTLAENPDEFEDYIIANVPTATIERWLFRKTRMTERQRRMQPQEPAFKLRATVNCVDVMQNVMSSVTNVTILDQAVRQLCYCIGIGVGCDGFNLFTSSTQTPDLIELVVGSPNAGPVRRIKMIKKLHFEHLFHQFIEKPVRMDKQEAKETPKGGDTRDPKFMLYVPITCREAHNKYIVELYRNKNRFYDEDEEIATSYMMWGNITLHYARLSQEMRREESLSDYILKFAKSIFQDIENEDMIVEKIMKYAQELVQADRASLFLVDQKNQELYSTIFDLGKNKKSGDSSVSSADEIRFPIGKGIAGCVAQTGETLNITNAYSDDRFNRCVDLKTGYRTRSILCMPINSRGQVIGVVQMVNKNDGSFTAADVEAFKVFAVYCGLALHNTKLYTRIKRSESKYRVAMDVLSYHNTCTIDEVRVGLSDLDGFFITVDSFYFDPNCLTSYQKVLNVVQMFIELFDLVDFDKTCLVRFVLTVKKNYRRLPYHNWTHGYSVCNTMYNIIKRSRGIFTRNECLALFVGALCHDLDHRGKNNKFMLETESPLASMYSTSTMEHHHFNQTVMVLNQEHHNIFVNLPNEDYKKVLKMLKHCILATDLALFFPNKDKLSKLLDNNEFNWDISEHRCLAMATAMTASDLSASSKPWTVQASTVKVIFKEFYEQGDAEREAGIKPLAMMDRNRPEELPASQVGFLKLICTPCMKMLSSVLPETIVLHRGCHENLRRWIKIQLLVQAYIQEQQRDALEVCKYMKFLIETETDLYYQQSEGTCPDSTSQVQGGDKNAGIQKSTVQLTTPSRIFKDMETKAGINFSFYDDEQLDCSSGTGFETPSGSIDSNERAPKSLQRRSDQKKFGDITDKPTEESVVRYTLHHKTENTLDKTFNKKVDRPECDKKSRKSVAFADPPADGQGSEPDSQELVG